MRLYRVKRKEDGKYLISADHRWRQWSNFNGCFTSTGAFWKQVDTVKRHIKILCSEYERKNEYRQSSVANASYHYTTFKRKSFHPERAELYQVECLNVSVNGAEIIEAKEFLK